jgi:hypothetical protein
MLLSKLVDRRRRDRVATSPERFDEAITLVDRLESQENIALPIGDQVDDVAL